MCDRHDKKELDHYCLEHEQVMCVQCATEEHFQAPCEGMPLVEASKHVTTKLDVASIELRKLKGVTQSILDGQRQDDTLRVVSEAEELLNQFVNAMKQKLDNARNSLRPFSELSREDRWKLKAVATKKIPNGAPIKDDINYHEARELATRLQKVRNQTKAAQDILSTLPNYVEVTINHEFIDTLKFDGNPITITRKGHAERDEDNFDDTNESASTVTHAQETVYLIEKSSFSLEHCSDIVMMDDYIIASVGDSVQKRDRKRMSFRQAMALHGAGRLCMIGETTEVSVLTKYGHIVVIETIPNMQVLYKIIADLDYHDISYLESVIGSQGLPQHSPVFVVCHSNKDTFISDYVDLIQAKPTRYPGKPPTYNMAHRTIAESTFGRNKSRFRGVTSVSSFQHRNIIVGALKGVTCISKSGILIWTIDLYKRISSVMSYRTLIFVAVQDEQKILTIGKNGHVIEENIIPINNDLFPERMCAHDDVLMVKASDKYKWIIFKKMYETV